MDVTIERPRACLCRLGSYGGSMRAARSWLTVAVVLVGVLVAWRPGARIPEPSHRSSSFPQGRWVTIDPPLGRVDRPITEFLTNGEIEVVGHVQRMVNLISLTKSSAFEGYDLRWHVEKSVSGSQMFRIQKKVVVALDTVLARTSPFMRTWPTDIVIARSQSFIRAELDRVGCSPDLSAWNGTVLMAAALCNRHMLVSNLTGLLFIVHAEQKITPQLERRREPPLAQIPYRVVLRGSTALAHEYVHAWRAAGQLGVVREDEPAWFSEGFAEFWAGIAKVLAYRGTVNYETQHVVRLRDFYDWAQSCTKPLSSYRSYSVLNNSCEYHVGTLAVEYLYSRYSSLQTTLDTFARSASYPTFAEGFYAAFGITLEQFESEASGYVAQIRRVELTESGALGSR